MTRLRLDVKDTLHSNVESVLTSDYLLSIYINEVRVDTISRCLEGW